MAEMLAGLFGGAGAAGAAGAGEILGTAAASTAGSALGAGAAGAGALGELASGATPYSLGANTSIDLGSFAPGASPSGGGDFSSLIQDIVKSSPGGEGKSGLGYFQGGQAGNVAGKQIMAQLTAPKKKHTALENIMKVAMIAGMFSSDKDAKTSITPVSGDKELRAVERLPVARWSYKGDSTPHIGPMAQDFYRAFDVGDDDRVIHVADAHGVTIAALQQLARRVHDLEDR